MFTGSLQFIDAQDDSNMQALSYSTKSCTVCRFTSAFAGVCKQKHSTKQALNYIPTSCSRDKLLLKVLF